MRGHEYIRDVVKAHLIAAVPVRLAVIQAGLDDPVENLDFLLDDGAYRLQSLPAVVIRASDTPSQRRTGEAEWVYDYSVEVIVACANDTIGNYEGATRQRDRLLLAVREALISPAVWPDDVELLPGDRPERTGPGVETVNSEPLAVGTITVTFRVTEYIDLDLTAIDGVDVTVTPEPPV